MAMNVVDQWAMNVEDQWELPDSSKRVTSVVLFGRTGNGKSATGNSILGQKAFKSKASSSCVTSTCESQGTVLKDGQIVKVIDTPGFFDFSSGLECITKEILKCICLGKDGIHVILLVYSVRTLFSRQEEAALQSFLNFFGEKITNYIILVFTGGDELEDNDETLEEHLGSGCPQPLKELIHQCNGRVVLFDNRTTDRTKRDNQVQQLLSMGNRVVRENSALPALNEIFKLLKEHSLMMHDTKELVSLKRHTKNETLEQFHHVHIEPSMRKAEKLLFVEQHVAEELAATFKAEEAVQEALNGGKTLARSLNNGGYSAIL